MNGMYSIDSINEIKKSWGDILPQEEMFIFQLLALQLFATVKTIPGVLPPH